MKTFLFVDKETNNIRNVISWGNDLELPQNYPIEETEYLVTLEGEEFFNRYQTEFLNNNRFKMKNPQGQLFDEILEGYVPEEVIPEPSEIEKLKQENLEIKLAMAELIEMFTEGGSV